MAETTAKALSEDEVAKIIGSFDRDSNREIRASDAVAEALSRSDDRVPRGSYCYRGSLQCPYWALIPELPTGLNGYCSKMRSGDWESEGLSLIWDQIKECGIAEDVLAEDDLLTAGEQE